MTNHEINLLPVILYRNLGDPLMIQCSASTAESANDFLEIVCKHANRWVSLTLGNEFDETTLDLLRRPMPALKALRLYTEEHDISDYYFPVSEAPALEFIHTWNTHMPWDSPSLSGLKYLSLNYLVGNLSSLHQLAAILIASPALEWFGLKSLWSRKRQMEDESRLPAKILLPALEGLILAEEMPSSMQIRYVSEANPNM